MKPKQNLSHLLSLQSDFNCLVINTNLKYWQNLPRPQIWSNECGRSCFIVSHTKGFTSYAVHLSSCRTALRSFVYAYILSLEVIARSQNPPTASAAIIMNGLLSTSEFNFDSSISGSGTSCTSSTDQGIGTTSGRAIQAVGEFVLRGVETIIVRRRIASVLKIFPHNNELNSDGLEKAYDDVLEISRCVYRISHSFFRTSR
jgi:hypothetical protein